MRKQPHPTNGSKPPTNGFWAEGEIPHDPEAEQAILGTILVEPGLYFESCLGLATDDFSFDSNRRIYAAMAYLFEDGGEVDMISLTQELQKRGELEAVGGVAYLSGLIDGCLPNAGHIKKQVDWLNDLHRKRQIIADSQNVIATAMERRTPAEVCIERMSDSLLRLAAEDGDKQSVKLSDYLDGTVSKWYARADNADGRTAVGLSFGNNRLDKLTTGMWPKEVTLLGGHTKDCKTGTAIQALIANLKEGTPCLYMSHEMDRDSVFARMVAQETTVPFLHLRDTRLLTSKDRDAIDSMRDWFRKLPLFINDAATMRIEKIVAISRLHARRDGVKLVVVDFLQKVQGPGDKKHEVVSNVSLRLCDLAKTEGVHAFILSQLTNPGDRDRSKIKPNMRMFRDSGDPVQDAHIIAAVWRPEEGGHYTWKDQILILGQRSGPGGVSVNVKLDRDRLKFVDREREEREEEDQAEIGYV